MLTNHPPKSPAAPALHSILDNAPPMECCGSCRFWNRDRSQTIEGNKVAPCRRYPITAVLVSQMQRGLQGPVMQQGPGTVPTVTNALDWCGEYELETRASVLRQNSEEKKP